ncbi:MAG: formylglycine-generating enzyme family protein [Nitrospira sp.]|nr:formylglycine-generating enzyme family protein [Nitrospira sp.]
MKKDAFFYGVVLAFVAFLLMIISLAFEAWRSGESAQRAKSIQDETAVVTTQAHDFSNLKIVPGPDGTPMVFVPDGTFLMGSQPVEGDSDEIPQRTIYLSSYSIDLYEVTHAKYTDFLKATRRPPPVIPVFADDLSLITKPELPVVGVSWEDAKAYCTWLGKRLPTESEWEKAARGERGFKWPWGNVFDETMANTAGQEDGYKYTAPPGKFEQGRSAYGLYDAAGNVAEWVSDGYDPAYYQTGPFRDPKGPDTGKHRVYRGGSWDDLSSGVRTAKRYAAAPHQTSAVIGFRCAMDAS